MKTILSLYALFLVCSLTTAAQVKPSSGKPAPKKTMKSAPVKSGVAKKPATAPQKKIVATNTPAAATVKNEMVNNTPANTLVPPDAEKAPAA